MQFFKTPCVTVEIGGQIASKIIGVGDVCVLRPSGVTDTIEIFSSGATTVAKVDILYGIESYDCIRNNGKSR